MSAGRRHKRTRWSEGAEHDRIAQYVRRVARMVVVRDDKVLVIKDWNGCNTLPGGGVHDNETFEQGAVRETEEEAGLVVTDSLPLMVITEPHCETHSFLAVAWHGDVRASDEGRPVWRDPDWLIGRRGASNDREIATVLVYLRECGLV